MNKLTTRPVGGDGNRPDKTPKHCVNQRANCHSPLHLKQAVIVEGKCDRVILGNVLAPDTVIIPVNGFGIYKDKANLALIRRYARSVGVILLTDSDNAGRQIRNYLKDALHGCEIHHVYVPNLLEVEDTAIAVLRERLAAFDSGRGAPDSTRSVITREMLFDDGFIGGADSSKKRKKLLAVMDLPENLSTNALLDALNICDYDYEQLLKEI
jgi:ribonuclease M5